ncbi:putative cytochrome P450 [Polyplosphaeria fusca]|uniref:Cytochrome P450 n=1 Tax=Polyplosphaeria fusca TaxID=682080 RepID=A0A9P4QQY1_9PLEO|nr:putative cytochrome P450 [Polyplosphaeria fusca]
MIALLCTAPFALFVVVRTYNWIHYYFQARKYDVPIIFVPVSFEELWWIVVRPLFSWVQHLPFGLGSWYLYTEMGFPQPDANRTFLRLNTENFILCSPKGNVIVTAYRPGLETVVGGGAKHWTIDDSQTRLFALFGENVASTNGAEWQRHRKITSTAFNERSFARVWTESIRRVAGLDLDGENTRTLGRLRSTFDIVAMEVLAVAGFGENMDNLAKVTNGHRESLMQSLGCVLKNILLTFVFYSLNGLKAPGFLLPSELRQIRQSIFEFKVHMEELLLQKLQNSKTSEKPSAVGMSLLESMVRANDYETTAGSLTFALSYLAAHPTLQTWLAEEIDTHFSPHAHRATEYKTIYPHLVRCLAFMYETLRMASPAPMLVRAPSTPDVLPMMTRSGHRDVRVPAGTPVGIHQQGVHFSARWGADVMVFEPRRFIVSSVSESGEKCEAVAVPEGVMYMPWAFGQRVCPGKKFSQVEFVALVAEILRGFRVEVVRGEGESEEEGRRRVLECLDDRFFNISAHLRRPEGARIRFVRR